MAILVDAARWPWRDTLWCHLVSDSSFQELHEFAAGLGCRRVGFQGDHYDIDIATRAIAIEHGATECDSRELVRRIRDAGLRVRPSAFEKWSLASRGNAFTGQTLCELRALDHGPMESLLQRLDTVPDLVEACRQGAGWFALHREGGAALVVHGTGPGVVGLDGVVPVGDDASRGIFVRVAGDASREWTIEIISPSPQPQQ